MTGQTHFARTQNSRGAAQKAASARPLILRCGALGDIVLLTPFIRQLHARFGKPVDLIASGPWVKPLLEGQPGVGDIYLVRNRRLPTILVPSQRQTVRWLKQRGPSAAWFGDVKTGRHLLTKGGIPDDYVIDARAYPWVPGEHFVDRWIRIANLTPPGLEGSIPPPAARVPSASVIELKPAARTALDEWLKKRGIAGPMIVIQMGSRHSDRRWPSRRRVPSNKYWPEERWVEVIRALRDLHPDHDIVLLGSGKEFEMNAAVQQAAGISRLYNAADNLPIPILLPLLERATGMVSVDTGPSHAAAALGCPVVSLFGDADPRLYRPGGPHTAAVCLVGQSTDPARPGTPDIYGITVQQVLDAWRSLHPQQAASAGSR